MRSTKRSDIPSAMTGEELLRRPRLGRCELVRGTIVHAHPTSRDHAILEARICAALVAFVEPRKLGRVLVGEAGIYTGRDPDTVRGADVAYVSAATYARSSGGGYLDVAPDLVVEVLSATDRRSDVEEKVSEYLRAGVRVVWIADPARGTIRVVRRHQEPPGPTAGEVGTGERLLSGDDILSGEDVLPGFEISVGRLFDG